MGISKKGLSPFAKNLKTKNRLEFKEGVRWKNTGKEKFEKESFTYDISDYVHISNMNSLKVLLFGSGTEKKALSPSAIKLYMYIILSLKRDNEIIRLSFNEVKEEIGISSGKFYSAKNELVERGLISLESDQMKGTYFYVNLDYIFRGKKKEYYETYYPKWMDFKGRSNLG